MNTFVKTATLADIYSEQAEWTARSGVLVAIDEMFSTVDLKDAENGKTLLFLQGNEADHFIDTVGDIWNATKTLPRGICELAAAYPYLDALEG